MPLIKAAQAWGLRPSAVILQASNPHGKWTKHDHLIAIAMQIIESEKGPSGYHRSIAEAVDNNLQWRVDEWVDHGEEAKGKYEERRHERQSKSKKPDGNHGVILQPIPYLVDKDKPWPDRAEWLRQQEEKRKALE